MRPLPRTVFTWVSHVVCSAVACVALSTSQAESPPEVRAPAELREMRWTLTLHLAEWGWAEEVRWRIDEADASVELCWPDDPMCTDTERHATLDDALAAIDARASAALETTAEAADVIDAGRPLRATTDTLRPIEKMFWALAHGGLDEMIAQDLDDLALRMMPSEADALLDLAATRYGLSRSGSIGLFADEDDDERAANGDLDFGEFVGDDGAAWRCGRDAPPGKYCCYVYCRSGDDSLAEGH